MRSDGSRSARASAVHSPVKPAPTIATSTSRSPSSGRTRHPPIGRHRRRPQRAARRHRRTCGSADREPPVRCRGGRRPGYRWPRRVGRTPTGRPAPAGWYADPWGHPLAALLRRAPRGRPHGAAGRHRPSPTACSRSSSPSGAVVVLLVSLIASRVLLEHIVQFGWPIVVYVAICVVAGYGPSVWWCWYATGRWGTGNRRDDLGLRLRVVRPRVGTRSCGCRRSSPRAPWR